MKSQITEHGFRWGQARIGRFALAALATLTFCSCQALPPYVHGRPTHTGPAVHDGMSAGGTLPAQAWTGGPDDNPAYGPGAMPVAPTAHLGIPLPQTIVTPWKPPGIQGPWPHDEYIHDGGIHGADVVVTSDLEVNGMDLEDTFVHFDTIDGRTLVEPSNRVSLYAPRFAAVRKVESLRQNFQRDGSNAVELPVKIVQQNDLAIATTALQQLQPHGEIADQQWSTERLNQGAERLRTENKLAAVRNSFKAYEDFAIIRQGIYEGSETARLAESVDAAITWSHDLAVQVAIDHQEAHVEIGDQKAQETFAIDVPNHPRLRVIKVASKQSARPGEIVDFTVRFDNLGDQEIGNVTLIDNLTTRLEYVPDSAQSSRKAEFFTQENEGNSLVLRWEFAEPLPAGKGGLVRFQCRVR